MTSLIRGLVVITVLSGAGFAAASGAPDILWSKKAHTEAVNNLAYSTDSNTLVSACNVIRVWNATTGVLKLTFDHPVTALAFAPDNDTLATSYLEYDSDSEKVIPVIRLWNISTEMNTEALLGHDSSVISLAFSPNGKQMASGDNKYDTLLWEVSNLDEPHVYSFYSNALAFSPDSAWLAGAGESNTARLWKTATHQMIGMGAYPIANAVAYSPDGSSLLVGGKTPPGIDGVPGVQTAGVIKVYRVSDREVLANMRATNDEVTCMAVHPDGDKLIAGYKTAKIRIWNLETFEISKEFDEETGTASGDEPGVRSIAISPNGKYFAYGRNDGKVVVAQWPDDSTTEGETEEGETEGEGEIDWGTLLSCIQQTDDTADKTAAFAGDGAFLAMLTGALWLGRRFRR